MSNTYGVHITRHGAETKTVGPYDEGQVLKLLGHYVVVSRSMFEVVPGIPQTVATEFETFTIQKIA